MAMLNNQRVITHEFNNKNINHTTADFVILRIFNQPHRNEPKQIWSNFSYFWSNISYINTYISQHISINLGLIECPWFRNQALQHHRLGKSLSTMIKQSPRINVVNNETYISHVFPIKKKSIEVPTYNYPPVIKHGNGKTKKTFIL